MNLYTYCGNDPINYTDPSGLFFGSLFKWMWKIVRIVAGVVFAVLAVLAFSIQQHWAGIALAMTSASIIASVFKTRGLEKIYASTGFLPAQPPVRSTNARNSRENGLAESTWTV